MLTQAETMEMEDPWWRKFLARLIFWFLIMGAALVGAYLGIALADTNAAGEGSYWPVVFGRKPVTDDAQNKAEALGVLVGLVLGVFSFPFLMRVTGLVSERTLQKMRTYRRRAQAERRRAQVEKSQMKGSWWRMFLFHLILWPLVMCGMLVGVIWGIPLAKSIDPGENAFWLFDLGRHLVIVFATVFGFAMGLLPARFVILFLAPVTGPVSEYTLQKMWRQPAYSKRTRAETSQMEDPWSQSFLAWLIFCSLLISGMTVGAYLGIALADTNATGEDALWPFEFGRRYSTDLVHGFSLVLGLANGCLLGYFAFPFLMRATGLVSERTLQEMWVNFRYRRRKQAETSQLEEPRWRRLIAYLIAFVLIIGGVSFGGYLGIALGETIATGENAFWPFDFRRRYGTGLVHMVPMILGASICGPLGAYVVFPFLMRVTGLVSERTLQKMLEDPRHKKRSQFATLQIKDPWWRRSLAWLIFWFLVISGLAVGGVFGLALVETISTGDNAIWPLDFGRPYGTDFVHGVVVVSGLAIGCLLGGFVFLFLMRVTGFVSERTLQKMV